MEELLRGLGLETETVTKIVEAMKEQKLYTTKNENIDIRYSKLKKDFEDSKKTIEELQAKGSQNEDLQKTILEYENKLKQTNIDYAIKDALKGVKHSELLKTQFDMTKLTFEDGQVKGIEEQLKTIKNTYKEFFEVEEVKQEPVVATGFVPVVGGNNKGGNKISYEQIINSNDPSLIADYFKNNKY